MNVSRTGKDGLIGIISLDEEITEDNVPQLDQTVMKLAGEGISSLLIDCNSLRYISSYGLSALLRWRLTLINRFSEQSAKLVVVCSQPKIIEAIRITRLDRLFTIYTDLETGLNALSQTEQHSGTGVSPV